MALHGICRSTWIAAAHGAPQPAGHGGGGADRDLRFVRTVRAVDRSARPLLHRSAITVDGAVGRALVWHGRVGPRHSVARHLWGSGLYAGADCEGADERRIGCAGDDTAGAGVWREAEGGGGRSGVLGRGTEPVVVQLSGWIGCGNTRADDYSGAIGGGDGVYGARLPDQLSVGMHGADHVKLSERRK